MHSGQFLGFAAVSLALALVPGPSWVYVISTTVAHNRRAGLLAVGGNATGIACHVLAVAAGLATILSYSTTVFLTVKWLGALYLIYLGVRTMCQPIGSRTTASDQPANEAFRIFGQGILVNLLNPKVALVMLALLPQFIDTSLGHIPGQLILIGLVHVVIASAVLVAVMLAAEGASRRIQVAPRAGRAIRLVAGTLFVALGLRLAW